MTKFASENTPPPLDVLANPTDEECYAFINGAINMLCITVVSCKTQQMTTKFFYDNAKRFIHELTRLFSKKFKAIILNTSVFKTSEYSNNMEFRRALKAKFDRIKIPTYFISKQNYILTSMIVAAIKPNDIKHQDIITIIIVQNEDVRVIDLEFTKAGYKQSPVRNVFLRPEQSSEYMREKLIGTKSPKQVILWCISPGNPIIKHLKTKVLHTMNLTVFEDCMTSNDSKFLVETAKWLLDNSYIKYFVIPVCSSTFLIAYPTVKRPIFPICGVTSEKELPFVDSVIVEKTNIEYQMIYRDGNTGKDVILEKFVCDSKAHRHEISITVDRDNFPHFKVQNIVLPSIELLRFTLDEVCKESKIPVIAFFDNLSFILAPKDGNYQFLDRWNGIYGREIVISFDGTNPKFCDDTVDARRSKPSTVIYDLINIMKTPVDKIKQDEEWGFKIIKDAVNPILLEHDEYEATESTLLRRKAFSPGYLMAIFLFEHCHSIKHEIGSGEKMPTELGFCYLNYTEKEDEKERQRIEKYIKEACNFLKIGYKFVEI